MSSRQPASLTPFQREIVKRAQASLALEGCSVSDEEALAIGQEFFGGGEAKSVEQAALALRARLDTLAIDYAAADSSSGTSAEKERPAHWQPKPKSPKNSARRR